MSFFKELKRRNVIRVTAAYIVIGWLLLQVADTLTPALHLPEWITSAIALVLILGIIPTLLFSWAYELTPEGLKKDSEVDKSTSDTSHTAKKLDIITLVAVAGVVGLVAWQQLSPAPGVDNQVADSSSAVAESKNNGQVGNKQTSSSAAAPFSNEIPSKSIAVLPFANRSNLDDDLFFTDGIHDDLLTQLAKISDMKVISRTSVMQYRGTEKTIPQIAKELGVATVLEGGVQRAGKRIRINAQLIDVATDEHLWAETFDREMTIDNLFDIQSEITKHIVTAVKGQLTSEEQNILEDKPTNSLAAWEAYSKAREVSAGSVYSSDTYVAMQPLVEEAIRLDPNFVLAHASLVQVHGSLYWTGYDQTEQRQQAAREALDKAIALAPNSPDVLAAQSVYLYRLEQDFAGALQLMLRAIAAKPGDSVFHRRLGLTQRRLGLWDESIASFLRTDQLDPSDTSGLTLALETLIDLRDEPRIKELLPVALERFPDNTELGALAAIFAIQANGDVVTARKVFDGLTPNTGGPYSFIAKSLPWLEEDLNAVIAAWQRPERQAYEENDIVALGYRELDLAHAYLLLGKQELASAQLAKAVELLTPIDYSGRNHKVARHLVRLASIYALLGDSEQALKLANEAMELRPIAKDRISAPSTHMAAVYALARAGERDKALEMIAQLLETPAGFHRWMLYLDPRWDFFRDDERFNKLIKPLNFDESMHAKNKITK